MMVPIIVEKRERTQGPWVEGLKHFLAFGLDDPVGVEVGEWRQRRWV